MTINERYRAIPKEERKRLAKEIFWRPQILFFFFMNTIISASLSVPIANGLLPSTVSSVIRFSTEILVTLVLAATIALFVNRPKNRAEIVKSHEA
jgi:hypothetical protein